MTSLRSWLASFRGEPVTVTELRRRIKWLVQQHSDLTTQRDALALDAVKDERAAKRWQRCHDHALALEQRLQVLRAALPTAEAQEAAAARAAEAAAQAARMQEFEQHTADAHAWLDALLARLPTGAELTRARDLRDGLRREASGLHWSRDLRVRRPLDPLHTLHTALAMRLQRIERGRWTGSKPITLEDEQHIAS